MKPNGLCLWAFILGGQGIGVCAPPVPEESAESQIISEISSIERLAQDIEADNLGPAIFAENHVWPVRHAEAQIAFLRKDYNQAAVILLGALEEPNSESLVGYVDAVNELAESLYQIRNLNGARKYFDIVYERGDSAQRANALKRTLEIATRLGNDAEMKALLDRIGGATANLELDYAVRYGLGKFYYRKESYNEAAMEFGRVPKDDPLYPQARYFLGVIDLHEGRIEAALNAFTQCHKDVEAMQQPSKDAIAVSELALLAEARLQYEAKNYTEATLAYSKIPYDSPQFEPIEQEVVWLAMREGNTSLALARLDIYLNSAPAMQLSPEMRLMRGMLLMERGALDLAESYFSTLAAEFDQHLIKLQSAYKTEFAERKAYEKSPESWRLPRRPHEVLPFIRPYGPELEIMALSDELANVQHDLTESSRVLRRLERILQLPSRVKFFPELYDGWLKVLEIRGRALLARSALYESAYETEAAARASKERANVLALESQFRQLPLSATAARVREKRLGLNLSGLEDRLFEIEVLLQSLLSQESVLRLRVRALNNPANLAEIDKNNAELADLIAELDRLQSDVDEQHLRFGERDSVAQSDEALRTKYAKALEVEQKSLIKSGNAPNKELVARIERLEKRAGDLAEELAHLGTARMLRTAKEVARERASLDAQLAEFKAYREQIRAIEQEIAKTSYERAITELSHYSRQARYGVLNVAWRRKELLQGSERRVAPISDPDALWFSGKQ